MYGVHLTPELFLINMFTLLIIFWLFHFLCADMPRPKRIRNLLKSVPGTLKNKHILCSLEHSVGNYVQVTSRQLSTQ